MSNIISYFDNLDSYFSSVIGRVDSLFSVKEASGQRTTIADLLQKYAANDSALTNAEEKLWAYQTGISKENTRSSAEVLADINRRNLNETDLYQRVLAQQQDLTAQQEAYAAKQAEIADLKADIKAETDKATKKELKAELKALQAEAKTLKLTKSQTKTLANMNKEMEAFSSIYQDSNYYDTIIDTAVTLRERYDEYVGLQEDIADTKAAISDAADKAEKKELKAELKDLKKEAKSVKLSKKQKKTLTTYESEIDAMTSINNFGITKNYADVLAKQSALQSQKDEYTELVAYIADLNAQIKEETDKAYKKELQKELKAAKKQAKKLKLSSSQETTLKALNNQVAALDELRNDAMVDNATASTAEFQELIKKIGNLQSKSKLSAKQQTQLAMMLDELNAINEGVAADKLKSYMSVYEKW